MFKDSIPDTLPRRERERLRRRHEMLRAAKAVFAEKGYVGATLDEIAQRAEFGKGTLYNYFEGGKEEIFFAIFDELYDDLYDLICASFASDTIGNRPMREVFLDFAESCIGFFLERQDLFMILIKEAHRLCFSDDQAKMEYLRGQRERMVSALVPALEAGMESGELKPLSPHAVAHLMLGNINGLQMHMALESEEKKHDKPLLHSPREAAEFLTTMLFDGLQAESHDHSSTNGQ